MNELSFSKNFDLAWIGIKDNLLLAAGLTFVYLLGGVVINFIPLAGILIAPGLTIGFIQCAYKLYKKEDFGFEDFFWAFAHFQRFIHLSILQGVRFLLIIAGFLMFIIPGIYLSVALAINDYVFLFNEPDGVNSIRLTLKMVKGKWWAILKHLILIGILNIFGLLLFGVGILITIPISTIILFLFFKDLDRIYRANQSDGAIIQ